MVTCPVDEYEQRSTRSTIYKEHEEGEEHEEHGSASSTCSCAHVVRPRAPTPTCLRESDPSGSAVSRSRAHEVSGKNGARRRLRA